MLGMRQTKYRILGKQSNEAGAIDKVSPATISQLSIAPSLSIRILLVVPILPFANQ